MTILAVCGMKREAALLKGTPVAIGRDFARAIDAQTRGLISFGIAGGLAPGLAPGTVVVPAEIVCGDERITTDMEWREYLLSRLKDAMSGPVAGSDLPVAGAGEKERLRRDTGALAVDMESHLVAAEARARAMPFVVLRIIADAAKTALPPAALVAMNPDGGIALGRVLGSVFRSPRQIPALIRTGRESEKAFSALLRCLDLLGPGLGCPYLG